MPNLNGILDKLGTAQYFSTVDIAKGFQQIVLMEKDRKKTAFSTLFRMPFGLRFSEIDEYCAEKCL